MKKFVCVLMALLMVATAAVTVASAEETKAMCAVVTEKRIAFDNVYEICATTADGNIYAWYDDDAEAHWRLGDYVLLIMMDYDEIIDVIMLGHLSPVGMAEWLR